jgi:hypothetical protein
VKKVLLPGWAISLLVAAWLIPGIAMRDVWKGIDWPLLIAPAEVQESALLAVILAACVALALLFTGLAARRLYGAGAGLAAVLGMAGSLGMLLPAHSLGPMPVNLALASLLLWGLAELQDHPWRASLIVSLALAAAFTAFGPGAISFLPLLALVVLYPLVTGLYTRPRVLIALFIALLASQLAVIPVALGQADFWAWWGQVWGEHWSLLTARRWAEDVYSQLLWFAFPLWPLALYGLNRVRRAGARSPQLWLPVLALLAWLPVLLPPESSLLLELGLWRESALLLLPPLALLAAAAMPHLKRGAANAFLWFGVMTFSVMALFFWLYIAAYSFGAPVQLAERLLKLAVPLPATPPWPLLVIGAVLTLLWFAGVPRLARSPVRPQVVWLYGLAINWILVVVLAFPVLEPRLGYQQVGAQIRAQVGEECVIPIGINTVSEQFLRHSLGNALVRAPHASGQLPSGSLPCGWILLASQTPNQRLMFGSLCREAWQGGRQGDRKEVMTLYDCRSPHG